MPDDFLLTMKDACELAKVSKTTLRRWEADGILSPARTPGGHRRYTKEQVMEAAGFRPMAGKQRYAIAYCRVSTPGQKADLDRQAAVAAHYCEAHAYRYKVMRDIGSGLNYKKKSLQEMVRAICAGEVSKVVVCDRDRLLRFGYELLDEVCACNGTEIEVINMSEDAGDDRELVEDVLAVVTVFSSRLYGKRSHRNKRIIEENKKLFGEGDGNEDTEGCEGADSGDPA